MKSMTGFGRGSETTDIHIANIEVNSVNRKSAEVIIQISRDYIELESEIKKFVLSKISRGRVSINITLKHSKKSSNAINIDMENAKLLSDALETISREINVPLNITSGDILRAPNILQFEEHRDGLDSVRKVIWPALERAMGNLLLMRESEGNDLKIDTANRLKILEQEIKAIEIIAPNVIEKYRNNLWRRLDQSGVKIDLNDDRIIREIGIFAEKCDISEEITRIHSHFSKFHEYLNMREPVGRSLDFLCQEINREFNTIGSKANDAKLAQHVVTAKTELEKIREQIQNVE